MLILRQLARHRFLRSTHIAALVDRSVDRANDRLCRLFHAGFVDRPRAQLDYYPASGSAPMVYALGDLGAELLAERGIECGHLELSRRNRNAGRPFIEHQLEIIDFRISLDRVVRQRDDISVIHSDELVSEFPKQTCSMRNPFTMRVGVSHNGRTQEIGLVPDLTFGIRFADSSRRCFMVEIDRGTMPIMRADLMQTSVARKMQAYLAAHSAKKHESQFGWKAFRVLIVTNDRSRARSMKEALRRLSEARSIGPTLFLFALRDELRASGPIAYDWEDGAGRRTRLA
ncbi:replication-relaxation family protein [Bradyrhizobium sp. CCBAU 53415]|uniref:replication-relaxation family protein n=1 Tax=Bradyrhizobium sp. CCBAU 53415 TaxID=1325119 RepID=UPI0023061DDD|nr:replication-relaxation family protein [Bradyrhizobium sp. CCBAU 53415]